MGVGNRWESVCVWSVPSGGNEMDDAGAIEGLKRLGLTTYEARVFVALGKLGSGTASEVSEVADVPRSQVYGAAEGLEERGLIETQQSTPTVYRPIPLEQARDRLLSQLEQAGEETFQYLESVQNTEEERHESESIWLVHGEEAVVSRTVELAESATDRVLYAPKSPEYLETAVLDALTAASERGLTVLVASADPEVHEKLPADNQFVTYVVPDERDMDVAVGRLLVADEDTLLLSTFTVAEESEVAFWTAETAFATVLIELAQAWFQNPFPE